MSIVAAFLWKKHPRLSLCTMIYDDENIDMLSPPKILYFPESYLRFRREAKNAIKDFFEKIKKLHEAHRKPVIIEFKIVFHAHAIPYLSPSKESLYIYSIFSYYLKKTKKRLKSIKIKPQLRNRLTGKALNQFKRELRSLYLVSRKKDTGYEYHLWTVALHATTATYADKIRQIRTRRLNAMWNDPKK
jgi:hypothetical protein